MVKLLSFALTLSLAVLCLSANTRRAAPTASITHSVELPYGQYDTEIAVTAFDPALGDLVSVVVESDVVRHTHSRCFENEMDSAATLSWGINRRVRVLTTLSIVTQASGKSVLFDRLQWPIETWTLGSYDGTVDFAGSSGRCTADSLYTNPPPVVLVNPADLADFTGPPSGASQVLMCVTRDGRTAISTSGWGHGRTDIFIGTTVFVTYTFTPKS